MEISGQLYVPAALPMEKNPVPSEEEDGEGDPRAGLYVFWFEHRIVRPVTSLHTD